MSEELWEKEHKEWIKNMFVHPKKPDDIPDNLWTRMNEMVGSYYNALPMLVNQASPDNVGCGTGATDLSMSPVYTGSDVIPVAMFAAPVGGKFQCVQCDMSFANKSAYTSHVRSHSKPPTPVNTATGTDPYKCDVCNKTFAVPARLVRHYRTHTGERPFECEFCHKMFSVKENLQVHRRIHTKERPYKCEVCGRAFEHSGKLHRHMRIHTGERPHKCSVCGKTFIQSGQLVIHLRTHTGEKPYRCSVDGCGKGFTCSKQLKVHSRTHTGEKPYHCDICFRDFGYNHVLKLHRVQHYGSKCYKCTICEETFKNKKDMEAHIKGHANDTTEAAEDKATGGAAVMSPETDSSCGSSTSNKENKHYAEPQDYYVYSRFEQSPLYGSGASPALLSAAEVTSEESGMSSQHEVTPSSSPTSHAHLEPSMYMYEPLEVMRQHGYFAPQPMSEYTPALDKSNDIIRRVEAALAVAEAPEAVQTSPTRSTSPDSDAMELAAAAAHREMMSLPPRKRKLYLRNLEPTPVVSAVRMSSVIQFAKAS